MGLTASRIPPGPATLWRVRAIAGRIEGVNDRWRIVALRIG
jgi:hypothetical protein